MYSLSLFNLTGRMILLLNWWRKPSKEHCIIYSISFDGKKENWCFLILPLRFIKWGIEYKSSSYLKANDNNFLIPTLIKFCGMSKSHSTLELYIAKWYIHHFLILIYPSIILLLLFFYYYRSLEVRINTLKINWNKIEL